MYPLNDYTATVYTTAHDKIAAVCNLHGEFTVYAKNHISTTRKQNCPTCHAECKMQKVVTVLNEDGTTEIVSDTQFNPKGLALPPPPDIRPKGHTPIAHADYPPMPPAPQEYTAPAQPLPTIEQMRAAFKPPAPAPPTNSRAVGSPL